MNRRQHPPPGSTPFPSGQKFNVSLNFWLERNVVKVPLLCYI